MFCPKCGKETPDNQAFCASCGAPLTQAATPGAPAERQRALAQVQAGNSIVGVVLLANLVPTASTSVRPGLR